MNTTIVKYDGTYHKCLDEFGASVGDTVLVAFELGPVRVATVESGKPITQSVSCVILGLVTEGNIASARKLLVGGNTAVQVKIPGLEMCLPCYTDKTIRLNDLVVIYKDGYVVGEVVRLDGVGPVGRPIVAILNKKELANA